MLKDSDLEIISHLRSGRRRKITEISRDLNIPVTTLYDRLDALERQAALHHTALVDFRRLGYKCNIHAGFKAGIDNKDQLESYLLRHPALNSLYRVNHDFDFLAHLVFRDIDEMKIFLSHIGTRFSTVEMKLFDVIDEMRRERFLSK